MEDMQKANVKKEILQRMKLLMDTFEEGDVKAIYDNLYSDDCVVMRTGTSFVKGQGARSVLQHLWNDGVRHIFMQNDDMLIREDVVVDRSHYILMRDDGRQYGSGKALTVWLKEGDEWMIFNDMWSEGYEKNQMESKKA